MRGHTFYAAVGLIALSLCALTAIGCGDDETTSTSTSTSAGESATQSVDEAVKSCTDEAQQLGGVAGTALDGACTSVGTAANQALTAAGANAQQALTQAASSCKSSVAQVPKGQAQDALSQLCDAIEAAGSG